MSHVNPSSGMWREPENIRPRSPYAALFERPPQHESVVQERGKVSFPEYFGERLYMIPFHKGKKLPDVLKRWAYTIVSMLEGIETSKTQELYIMVDESYVSAGKPHRRPGLHIDGHWQTTSGKPNDETILLASSVEGCNGYTGTYYGTFGLGGDVSQMNCTGLTKVPMKANRVYAGNVKMVHESVPLKESCQRTLVRINVPGHILLRK